MAVGSRLAHPQVRGIAAGRVSSFGKQVPLGRAGQPAEVAPAFVMLASGEASYISSARLAVTGGKPIL
jgi:NAD(P)-dependent dehydrogenase (short-subunit alcohol dehydrogenase family)